VIAVIFEVLPHEGRAPRYFEIAASMREELERIDGFVSVERFESLATPGKFLSLSFWRDEAAVLAWRSHAGHRAGQREGRSEVFAGYRIRVAQVLRDYGLAERDQAPADSRAALE
jgi:heme-degrading monooxygenase HmoA